MTRERANEWDFYMATTGDFLLATNGDYRMAMGTMLATASRAAMPRRGVSGGA